MEAAKERINLKGLSLAELEAYVRSLGEPRFRAKQLFHWLYAKGEDDLQSMTNLSRTLRERIGATARTRAVRLITSRTSEKDQTEKFLFELNDGERIESVLMFDDGRTTLCVSTQVGCALDCKFCATGTMGLRRQLKAGEIVDQFLGVQRERAVGITNVVFMGMGEPLHNYENVIQASDILSDPLGPHLGRRRIVISTSGLVPAIRRFADEGHRYRLAISLNATTDEVRSRIMPINKKWPMAELLEAAKYYTKRSGEMITFEYVLLAGINDAPEDAARLEKLVRGISCKVNLIPYNPTMQGFKRPDYQRVQRFYERLAALQAPVTIRWSKGDDVAAGCGQLATEVPRGNPL